jgi:hypothetical protein
MKKDTPAKSKADQADQPDQDGQGSQVKDNQDPEQVGVKVPQNQGNRDGAEQIPDPDQDEDAGRVPNLGTGEEQDAPMAEAGSGLRGDPLHHGISN